MAAQRHAALLRGINVGGKNKLPMKDLTQMFAAAGCANVVSYIQSGNVVFDAPAKALAGLPARIEKAVMLRFGFTAPVIVRSASELVRIVEGCPFVPLDPAAGGVYVAFLREAPTPARALTLDPKRSPGDEFRLVGTDIYLRLGNGAAKTKLTNAYFDAKLATISTMRNWNTLLKLVELTRG